jgi:hypothetical protein
VSSDMQPYKPGKIEKSLDKFSEGLSDYLNCLGLPAESVLVKMKERRLVINIVPDVVEDLNPSQRMASMYISKFIAACAVGLFDAALNYLWNETVRNLREKVARFDLEYFYDSVVTDTERRSKLKDESDLENLDDWVLVQGCQKTGIISDIGYKHLEYIKYMRNYASAAHPNHNDLTGLNLADWLQTCIKEVLGKEPDQPAFEVRKLLRSLREEVLSKEDVPPIALAVQQLPNDLSRSLLRSMFGMYTDQKLGASTRNNIQLVAKEVWQVCSDDARYDAGLKHDSFSANGEVYRAKLAREFLELVDGLAYLSPGSRAVEITAALDDLLESHYGWNNFYNELSPARRVRALVPDSGDVPDSVAKKYVKVLTMCRMGNGYGVSVYAQPIYENLISRWQDKHITIFVSLVKDTDVVSRLQHTFCAKNYQMLAKQLGERAININLKAALDFITTFPTDKLANVKLDSRFQQMLRTLGIQR